MNFVPPPSGGMAAGPPAGGPPPLGGPPSAMQMDRPGPGANPFRSGAVRGRKNLYAAAPYLSNPSPVQDSARNDHSMPPSSSMQQPMYPGQLNHSAAPPASSSSLPLHTNAPVQFQPKQGTSSLFQSADTGGGSNGFDFPVQDANTFPKSSFAIDSSFQNVTAPSSSNMFNPPKSTIQDSFAWNNQSNSKTTAHHQPGVMPQQQQLLSSPDRTSSDGITDIFQEPVPIPNAAQNWPGHQFGAGLSSNTRNMQNLGDGTFDDVSLEQQDVQMPQFQVKRAQNILEGVPAQVGFTSSPSVTQQIAADVRNTNAMFPMQTSHTNALDPTEEAHFPSDEDEGDHCSDNEGDESSEDSEDYSDDSDVESVDEDGYGESPNGPYGAPAFAQMTSHQQQLGPNQMASHTNEVEPVPLFHAPVTQNTHQGSQPFFTDESKPSFDSAQQGSPFAAASFVQATSHVSTSPSESTSERSWFDKEPSQTYPAANRQQPPPATSMLAHLFGGPQSNTSIFEDGTSAGSNNGFGDATDNVPESHLLELAGSDTSGVRSPVKEAVPIANHAASFSQPEVTLAHYEPTQTSYIPDATVQRSDVYLAGNLPENHRSAFTPVGQLDAKRLPQSNVDDAGVSVLEGQVDMLQISKERQLTTVDSVDTNAPSQRLASPGGMTVHSNHMASTPLSSPMSSQHASSMNQMLPTVPLPQATAPDNAYSKSSQNTETLAPDDATVYPGAQFGDGASAGLQNKVPASYTDAIAMSSRSEAIYTGGMPTAGHGEQAQDMDFSEMTSPSQNQQMDFTSNVSSNITQAQASPLRPTEQFDNNMQSQPVFHESQLRVGQPPQQQNQTLPLDQRFPQPVRPPLHEHPSQQTELQQHQSNTNMQQQTHPRHQYEQQSPMSPQGPHQKVSQSQVHVKEEFPRQQQELSPDQHTRNAPPLGLQTASVHQREPVDHSYQLRQPVKQEAVPPQPVRSSSDEPQHAPLPLPLQEQLPQQMRYAPQEQQSLSPYQSQVAPMSVAEEKQHAPQPQQQSQAQMSQSSQGLHQRDSPYQQPSHGQVIEQPVVSQQQQTMPQQAQQMQPPYIHQQPHEPQQRQLPDQLPQQQNSHMQQQQQQPLQRQQSQQQLKVQQQQQPLSMRQQQQPTMQQQPPLQQQQPPLQQQQPPLQQQQPPLQQQQPPLQQQHPALQQQQPPLQQQQQPSMPQQQQPLVQQPQMHHQQQQVPAQGPQQPYMQGQHQQHDNLQQSLPQPRLPAQQNPQQQQSPQLPAHSQPVLQNHNQSSFMQGSQDQWSQPSSQHAQQSQQDYNTAAPQQLQDRPATFDQQDKRSLPVFHQQPELPSAFSRPIPQQLNATLQNQYDPQLPAGRHEPQAQHVQPQAQQIQPQPPQVQPSQQQRQVQSDPPPIAASLFYQPGAKQANQPEPQQQRYPTNVPAPSEQGARPNPSYPPQGLQDPQNMGQAMPFQPKQQPFQPVSSHFQGSEPHPGQFATAPGQHHQNAGYQSNVQNWGQPAAVGHSDPMQVPGDNQSQAEWMPDQSSQYPNYAPGSYDQYYNYYYNYPGYGYYQQWQQQQQQYYGGFGSQGWDNSSIHSSSYADSQLGSEYDPNSRPSSVQEVTSHDYDDELSMYEQNAKDVMLMEQEEEEVPMMERLTPLHFLKPHLVARFSKSGSFTVSEASNPKDGIKAKVNIIPLKAIADLTDLVKFPGPLVAGETSKKSIMKFAKRKVEFYQNCTHLSRDDAQDHSLLWDYISLLTRHNGHIDGSDVAEMLVHYAKSSGNYFQSIGSASEQKQDEKESKVDHLRETLYQGCRKEALEFCAGEHLWGHALVLSFFLDPKIHQALIGRFLSSLDANDPLLSLYTHLAQKGGHNQDGDWRLQLAMFIANPSKSMMDDKLSMAKLGDMLATDGKIAAAHLVYLLSNVKFGDHKRTDTKFCLLGGDHTHPLAASRPDLWATNEMIQLTEIFEYLCCLQNDKAFVPPFQYFKYIYATRLAEAGLLAEAFSYVELIAEAIIADPRSYDAHLMRAVHKFACVVFFRAMDAIDDDQPPWMEQLEEIADEKEKSSRHHDSIPGKPHMTRRPSYHSSMSQPQDEVIPPSHVTHQSSVEADDCSQPAAQHNSLHNDEHSTARHGAPDMGGSHPVDNHIQPAVAEQVQSESAAPIQYHVAGTMDNSEVSGRNDVPTLDHVPMFNPSNQTMGDMGVYSGGQDWQSQSGSSYVSTPRYGQQSDAAKPPALSRKESSMSSVSLPTHEAPTYQVRPVNEEANNEDAQYGGSGYQQHVANPAYNDPMNPYEQPGANNGPYPGNVPNSYGYPPYQQQSHTDTPQHGNQQAGYPPQSYGQHGNQQAGYPPQSYGQQDDAEGDAEEEDLFNYMASKAKRQGSVEGEEQEDGMSRQNATVQSSKPASGMQDGAMNSAGGPEAEKGWFGGLFSRFRKGGPKEAYLPDDKEKSLIYDKDLGKWIDKTAPQETYKPPPPPPTGMVGPSIPASNTLLSQASMLRQPLPGMPAPGNGDAGDDAPPAGPSRFSRKAATAQGRIGPRYVDAFGGTKVGPPGPSKMMTPMMGTAAPAPMFSPQTQPLDSNHGDASYSEPSDATNGKPTQDNVSTPMFFNPAQLQKPQAGDRPRQARYPR